MDKTIKINNVPSNVKAKVRNYTEKENKELDRNLLIGIGIIILLVARINYKYYTGKA